MPSRRFAINKALLSLTFVACTASPPELLSTSGGVGAATVTATAEPISGYTHSLHNSLFDPGKNQASVSENGFNKVVGDYGVFAVDATNASVTASRSSTGTRVKYSGTPAQHNTAVRAYFVNAGMPDSQIGDVHVNTLMQGGGKTSDGYLGLEPSPEIVGFATSVGRKVSGFTVHESIAWAELDGNGKAVAETIYWPELPGSVLDDAKAFATMLADNTKSATFMAKLPPGLGAGAIVIHHTGLTERRTFEALVTFDASSTAVGHTAHHFDASGSEVRLSGEQTLASTTKR